MGRYNLALPGSVVGIFDTRGLFSSGNRRSLTVIFTDVYSNQSTISDAECLQRSLLVKFVYTTLDRHKSDAFYMGVPQPPALRWFSAWGYTQSAYPVNILSAILISKSPIKKTRVITSRMASVVIWYTPNTWIVSIKYTCKESYRHCSAECCSSLNYCWSLIAKLQSSGDGMRACQWQTMCKMYENI